MTVDLKKHLTDLSKQAAFAVNKHGLEGLRAQVVLVLDISKSMNPLYRSCVMQRVMERILGLALNVDDDGNIDLMLFGTRTYRLPAMTLEAIEGYVERVILPRYKIMEATYYAPPLRMIWETYRDKPGDPVFVIFLTDGGNADCRGSAAVLRAMSAEPVFTQFVGIGKETFPFLERLDDLDGRRVDNAGLMAVNDIAAIKDGEWYDRLLNEFPQWLSVARQKGILRPS